MLGNEGTMLPRKFIEKGLPIRKISEASRKEKKGRPKISEMHYWWTRKPLITARTAVLGAFLSNEFSPSSFEKILGLKRSSKPFLYQLTSNDRETIQQAIQQILSKDMLKTPEELTILDPFAGGGMIPLEALRMGFSVDASDYNPVAWLIMKATLEYPRKYGNNLLDSMKKVFKKLRGDLVKEFVELYPPSPVGHRTLGYLYCWMVICPNCKKKTPLVNNWRLGDSDGENKYFLNPTIEDDKLRFSIEEGTTIPKGTNVRGKGRCLFCGFVITNEEIVSQISTKQEEKLLAVVYRIKNKTLFRLPTKREKISFKKSAKILKERNDLREYIPDTPMPLGVIRAAKYLKTWDKIYFPRQVIYLANIVKLGREIIKKYQEKHSEEFGLAIGFYIACFLAKVIIRNCRLATWQTTAHKVGAITAFRTYPLIWDHFEVHPFEGASGSLDICIEAILKGLEEAIYFSEEFKGEINIFNSSVLELSSEKSYDAIITDPPYLDDVPYPEVSDLFFVWQQKLLEPYLSEINPLWLNHRTPRDEDLSSNHKDRSDEFVNMGLAESFKVLHRLLKNDGVLALFYAHSKLEAWEFVVNALIEAGFKITSTYPLTTENITSPITTGKASIFSSILLFAKKRTSNPKGVLEELGTEIEEKIYPRLEEFWASGLRHADLTGAAIGPVLEVITGYGELKSKFGKIDVLNMLQLASQHVIKFVLSKHTGKSILLDPATSFFLYTAVENVNGKKGIMLIPYDNAHILSKSINADLKFMEHQGLIDDGGTKGRKNRVVRFLSHDMRDIIEGATLIDAVHRAMKAYSSDGRKGLQEALKEETHNLEEIKVALELLARADNPPGKDGEVARKILGLRDDLKKGDKTILDFFS